jgi:lysozyme
MEYSDSGIRLTEQFEGCRLAAYPDSTGKMTIGYGHAGPDVVAGLTITQDQATSFLAADIKWASDCVNRLVTYPITQEMHDGLTDLVFNIGSGNFENSTMLKLLNQGELSAAAAQFERWDRAGGVEVAGLLRRRQAEEALFDTNDQS